MVNNNCKKCPKYIKGNCNSNDERCICKYCPRNIEMCIITRWCRETESDIYFDED